MAITHPEFGFKTTATETAKAFSDFIRGKTILITGISPNSIGASLALAVSAHSPKLLILASRTLSNLLAIKTQIHSTNPEVKLEIVVLDLSDTKSVRRAAQDVGSILEREGDGNGIDVLFNNAGINANERILNGDGIEIVFATNHLGPFLFTGLLLPYLLTPNTTFPRFQKRIVNTSSEAHRISPFRFSDWNFEPEKAGGKGVEQEDLQRRSLPKGLLRGKGGYEPMVAYGASKTANLLHVVGLRERVGGNGVGCFGVMPGTIMTGIVTSLDEQDLQGLFQGVSEWKTLDQGAATLVVAGFDPGLDNEQGIYLEDCQMKRPSKWAVDKGKAERLWKLSEELVGGKVGGGVKSLL